MILNEHSFDDFDTQYQSDDYSSERALYEAVEEYKQNNTEAE